MQLERSLSSSGLLLADDDDDRGGEIVRRKKNPFFICRGMFCRFYDIFMKPIINFHYF